MILNDVEHMVPEWLKFVFTLYLYETTIINWRQELYEFEKVDKLTN